MGHNVKNTKNLTITELKKLNKGLDKQEEVNLIIEVENDDGDMVSTSYKFTYDKKFRKSKKVKVMEDIVKLYEEAREHSDIMHNITPYISIIIIKHYTSINVPDDVHGAMELLAVLVDLEILDDILDALPEDQVTGILEDIESSIKQTYDNLIEQEQEVKDEEDQLMNEEIKNMIDDDSVIKLASDKDV